MRRSSVALSVVLLLNLLTVSPAPAGTPAENPYQAEFEFAVGRPVEMRVDVEGVSLESIRLTTRDEVKPETFVKCEIAFVGSNAGDKKATLSTVLLLEDGDGKGLDQGRITLDEFKVKGGKSFEEIQTVTVRGDTLAQAVKVYVLVTVAL